MLKQKEIKEKREADAKKSIEENLRK